MNEWISVKDQIPEENSVVIFFVNILDNQEERIFTGSWQIWSNKTRHVSSNMGDGYCPYEWESITHWMPLPKPPQK